MAIFKSISSIGKVSSKSNYAPISQSNIQLSIVQNQSNENEIAVKPGVIIKTVEGVVVFVGILAAALL